MVNYQTYTSVYMFTSCLFVFLVLLVHNWYKLMDIKHKLDNHYKKNSFMVDVELHSHRMHRIKKKILILLVCMHKTFFLQFSYLYLIYSHSGYNRNTTRPRRPWKWVQIPSELSFTKSFFNYTTLKLKKGVTHLSITKTFFEISKTSSKELTI